jgi:hypothetical protein
MKRNFTLLLLFAALFAAFQQQATAQPDYSFIGGSLTSGTARQVGAVYKYTNVRTGVDATVTITAISSGITVVDLDAGSGYPEALQPTLQVDPNTNGYLEMQFQLLVAGTNTPYTALELPVTCIDVDGTFDQDGNGNPLYEFDEINLGPGGMVDFETYSGELMISNPGDWYCGKNVGGVDYPGRDTTARGVMFTVINTNVSNFTIRVGADNQSTSQTNRLRSVYFKRFTYSHFPLALPKILEFRGNISGDDIKLNWQMEASAEWEQCVLERAVNNRDFSTTAVFLQTDIRVTQFNYTDNSLTAGNYLYRLKLVDAAGKTKYSNILSFKTGMEAAEDKLVVYPSLVTEQFNVKFKSAKSESTLLEIFDFSGKKVYRKQLNLLAGENNIAVSGFNLIRGNYIVAVKSAEKILTQKISIQ